MRELVAASLFYMLCSAGMSVFNKLAVRAMPLPITLVVIQMGFTLVSVSVQRKSVHIGSFSDALRWGLTVPVLFAAMLVRAAQLRRTCTLWLRSALRSTRDCASRRSRQ